MENEVQQNNTNTSYFNTVATPLKVHSGDSLRCFQQGKIDLYILSHQGTFTHRSSTPDCKDTDRILKRFILLMFLKSGEGPRSGFIQMIPFETSRPAWETIKRQCSYHRVECVDRLGWPLESDFEVSSAERAGKPVN
ncbi:hypothetical protein AVEN_198160-1 [Araneus ventricosus]|uniref:Uncharacterized protein n=1 Tax=Araneus ventricosus TaxID=182803 RepID=A0A4Y2GHT2_ARAVE|nr:hypothetical protein AVEN_198160-1 [Araneus ventricosus]